MQQNQLPLWILEPSAHNDFCTAAVIVLYETQFPSSVGAKWEERLLWSITGEEGIIVHDCYVVVCSLFIATLGRCSPSVREHTATICHKAVTTSVSSQWCGKACCPECILKCDRLCSQDSQVQVFSHWPRSYCLAQPPHCVAFEPLSSISPPVQTDAALQSTVTQQVFACHSFPQELPDHHGHHLTAWQERTTSPQQCRAYTHWLTITWTAFRRWRRESQGRWAHTALCWAEHCLAEGELFNSATPFWWLICAEHPQPLFTEQSFPLCCWVCLIQHLRDEHWDSIFWAAEGCSNLCRVLTEYELKIIILTCAASYLWSR